MVVEPTGSVLPDLEGGNVVTDEEIDLILRAFAKDVREVRKEHRPGRSSTALTVGRFRSLCRCYGATVQQVEARRLKQAV